MHRQTQGQASRGAQAGYGVTDWQALEIQLNRTRTILQDILVHLQEVLRNLKSARQGGRGQAASETGGASRFGAKDSRFRAQASSTFQAGHTGRAQRQQAGPTGPGAAAGSASGRTAGTGATGGNGASGRTQAGTAGGADWFRNRTRPHAEGRADPGQSRFSRGTAGPQAGADQTRSRTTTGGFGDKARDTDNRTFRTGSSRSQTTGGQAGQAGRERPRAESTFRASGAAGGNTTAGARPGPSAGQATAGAGQARTGARPAGRAGAGFRMDQDRQARARQMARRSGMNLKCAYDILCLDYPCTVDEIKVAYRHMARLYHPDLGGDEEAMKDVNVAYELAMRFSAGPRRASTAWAV